MLSHVITRLATSFLYEKDSDSDIPAVSICELEVHRDMSHDTRQLVLEVTSQVKHKLACTDTEEGQKIEICIEKDRD